MTNGIIGSSICETLEGTGGKLLFFLIPFSLRAYYNKRGQEHAREVPHDTQMVVHANRDATANQSSIE